MEHTHRRRRIQRRRAVGTRAIEHLLAIAIEAELVPVRRTVLIPNVSDAFDDVGVPIASATSVAMTVILDEFAWWSALLVHGRAQGGHPPAVFSMGAALAALPPEPREKRLAQRGRADNDPRQNRQAHDAPSTDARFSNPARVPPTAGTEMFTIAARRR